MIDQKACDHYPFWVPLLSVLQAIAIYALGAWILSGFGLIAVISYLLFCLWHEYQVINGSCRYCYYYGKLCGLGKGMIAPLFVKKGDPKMFLARDLGWKDLIPDMLVLFIPLLGGIIRLISQFDLFTLGLLAVIVVLAMPVTGLMRSSLLCPNCQQRELGCPAEKLFGKNKQ